MHFKSNVYKQTPQHTILGKIYILAYITHIPIPTENIWALPCQHNNIFIILQ
jgi:hypothetical protein